MARVVKIFVSYSHKDPHYLQDNSLLGFLKGLEQEDVQFWTDRDIRPGESWDEVIKTNLVDSQIALALVSQGFLNSRYCQDIEIRTFLENTSYLFPIILSPCEWQRHDWLASRQFLPADGETIEQHYTDPGRRKALFVEILQSLRERIELIRRAELEKRSLSFEPATVLIPAGTLVMGSQAGDGIPDSETPQHEVELDSYRMGRYPVTNRQYAEFIRREKLQDAPDRKSGWILRQPPADKLDHPVVSVSWFDAKAYCDWLSRETGFRYRLPTEAEWEKAARGTDARLYPWGNAWGDGRCTAESNGTLPVDAHPQGASIYDCYDMLGNVQEWTSTLGGGDSTTCEFRYPYRSFDGRESTDADWHLHRVQRVQRGGCFRDNRTRLRCAARGFSSPHSRIRWRGLRVARDL
jgi:formylglycine-generating enzyme required for sulfatase activity